MSVEAEQAFFFLKRKPSDEDALRAVSDRRRRVLGFRRPAFSILPSQRQPQPLAEHGLAVLPDIYVLCRVAHPQTPSVAPSAYHESSVGRRSGLLRCPAFFALYLFSALLG